MYARSGKYDIFNPNDKVREKFYQFLTLTKPILEGIDRAGDAYVLLLPYIYTVEYDSRESKYKFSVLYAIINDTKAIEQKQIDPKSFATGVKFQYDTRDKFIDDINAALKAKSNKKYILVTNYPLYEKLRQAFAEDIAKGALEVKSIYTVGLYYYISKMVDENSINQNASIDNICGNVSTDSKTFSRSKVKGGDNFLIANRSSLSMAGLSRNSAQAVITLPEEIIDGFTMFYGFRLTAPNVICKSTKQPIANLLAATSMYSSITPDYNQARYYRSTTTEKPKAKVSVPEDLKPYLEITRKVAEIVFQKVPKNIEDFLDLLNDKLIHDLEIIVKKLIVGYEQYLISMIESKEKFRELNTIRSKKSFIEYIEYVYRFAEPSDDIKERLLKTDIALLSSTIATAFQLKAPEESLPLAALIRIYVCLIRYRDPNKLNPKAGWSEIVKYSENLIKKINMDLEPPQPLSSTSPPVAQQSQTAAQNQSNSKPRNDTTPTADSSSVPPNLASASQPLSPDRIYVLPTGRFIECDLFDAKNAFTYCTILLPQERYDDISKDPLGTIIDMADYICNFQGGMFSNVDQIYKLEENSVPDVPVSFEKYYLKNLMIHTCDQHKDAIQLLYRQAQIDVEAVANNIALEIINEKFSPSNTQYLLNIIVLKSKYTNVKFTELKDLSQKFSESVFSRLERMSFVLDDKDRDKVLKNIKTTYNFICHIHVVNDDGKPDLEEILRNYTQDYCQNIVYMLDDHQHLHEMQLPLDEIQEYTLSPYYPTFLPFQILISKAFTMPLTGYAHYVIAYTLNYLRSKNSATQDYKKRTTYRVLMNSKSFSHDYARLLAYVYLLFNIKEFAFTYGNHFKKIDIEQELEYITKKAESETRRSISFSNKPYTVSLKAIQQFIDRVNSQTWYRYGFSRCNPARKKLFEDYYEISNQVYEGFMKSTDYADHADQIISACQVNDSNAMDDSIGRVYLSILKPQEFSAINNAISQSTQNNPAYNIYFEKIRKYVENVVTNINNLYDKFFKKLNGYDTPDIDYNIETKLLNTAFRAKGKMDAKSKLRFLDDLELDYVERIAYIMSAYMLKQLRASFKPYADWEAVLEAVFGADKLKTLLASQLEGLSEDTYEKVDKIGKSLGLSNAEQVILILNYLYLNRLYTEQNQDIEETFRVLTDDLLVTSVSEASIYRTQILIAGIRMFLQNFICDLYSKSKGNEFMDANRFSGNYLIICEDSDIAAALASSLSILLHFRSKTDKAMKEIELVARQFYSNLFKTLYKRNNKWYNRIKDKIIGTSKNKYYDEELQFMDLTINAMNHALSTSEKFINGNDFNSDYPLYGLSALVFILSIPLTVSLAMSVGDKDSTVSMIGMVYKYQDAMSAHGITLSNNYCEAGYEQPELELPEDTKLSHITDFPVSTNLISKETLFDKDNYDDAITTISEVLTHRAKTMDQSYGQVIVTDDITRVGVDMSNVNTIIILAGRRNAFSQSERQGTLILDKQIADSLYEQTGRKANVYYVTFEYDSRIDDMTQDSYLKPRFNTNVQKLYSVMSQVSQIRTTTGKSLKGSQKSQAVPTVLTIAII
jgi:hypothetical protein